WVVFPLIALFVALALSMFGLYELSLPSGLQAKLNQVGGKGFGGAFGMGLVGGLIAAPCTGPFLIGLLGFVSTTGNAFGGGALLLAVDGGLEEKLRKGVAVAMVLAGALGIWTWKLTPKHRLPWLNDEQAAFAQARAQHKGVLVDFAASWCVPCDELELTYG